LGAPFFVRLHFNDFQDYPFVDFEFRFPQAVYQSPGGFNCPVTAVVSMGRRNTGSKLTRRSLKV
jgi:hypothetical protein